MNTLEELERWLYTPLNENESKWIEQANMDDAVIAYAEYLVEEYGQTHDEALENAIITGKSVIRKNHPFFSGANNNE